MPDAVLCRLKFSSQSISFIRSGCQGLVVVLVCTYLPARTGLTPVVRIVLCDEVVNAAQVELSIWRVHDCLGDELRIAILRFDVLILVRCQINITGVHQQGAGFLGR